MSSFTSIFASVVFALVAGVGVLLQLVTLPGVWVILVAALLYQTIVMLTGNPVPFHWWVLGVALALGLLAEVVELATTAVGAAAGGARGRGAGGALLGSVIGAVVGIFAFAFIPVLGSLIGGLLGAALGAAIGAFVGELSYGDRTARQAVLPAVGAAMGRVAGVVAKLGVAIVIWVMLVIDAFM